MQEEKVQNVKWATRDEIKQIITDNLFVPYHASLIDMMFDSDMNYGMHKK